jgi:hypothetical protein
MAANVGLERLIMIALIVLLIILQGYACYKLYTANTIHSVLAFSIVFYLILWIILPGFISLLIYSELFGGQFSSDIISSDYIVLYSLESAIFLCVVVVSVYLWKVKNRLKILQNERQLTHRSLIIVLIGFLVIVSINYILGAGVDYLERNDARNYDSSSALAFINIAYNILEASIAYVTITMKYSKLVTSTLFISLIIGALIETMNGSRIAMVLPIFVFFCRMHFSSKDLAKNMLRIAILSIASAFILMPAAIAIERIRTHGQINMDMIMGSAERFMESTDDILAVDMAATLLTKFNSFSSGLSLIDGYGSGSAGIRPYIGSVLVFMPRYFFPDRPVAGSIDGTIYGTPPRLVPQLETESYSSNVGVSPYAVSVWHFGCLLGGAILIVGGVFNILLLQYLFSRNNIVYKIFAVYLIKVSSFVGIFNSPDVLLKNAIEIAIMGFIVAFLLKNVRLTFRLHSRRRPLGIYATSATQ